MVRRIVSWVLGIASPSKAMFVPDQCAITGCNLKPRYIGVHWLLSWTLHVCWWHRWTVANARLIVML